MRIDSSLLVLGLAAWGYLPTGSARVLYGYVGSEDLVGQSQNDTTVEQRAVPVIAPKPVPVKPIVEAPEPIVPGAKPAVPGDKAPDAAPAPLIPEEKPPPAPVTEKDPAAPATDKDPAASTDKKDDAPLTKEEELDLDLFCPADAAAGALVKRSLEARGRDGKGCSSRAGDRRGEDLNRYYDARATKADGYISSRPYSNTDFTSRTNANYRVEREPSPEPFIGDTLGRTRLRDRGYEFDYVSEKYGDFQTHSTFSPGNKQEPVARISYGRNARDREDLAMIAHERFADRDSNRYQLDSKGRARTDERGNYINADGYKDRAVATSQLSHEGAKRYGAFNPPPRRATFISEDIQGVESRRLIDDGFTAVGKKDGDYHEFKRDSTGAERDYYRRITSNDNNYSWTNTAARNREYGDLQPRSLEAFRSRDKNPKYDTAYNWERR